MILFPNAKINIGLDVLKKRTDGFHDLETILYPIQLCDILEINKSDEFIFTQSGIEIEGDLENNLVVKAFRLLQNKFDIPTVHIHLHKQIPFGAGLGGGSSDAAYTLLGINELFKLKIGEEQLIEYAAILGSDCPFFILNQPAFAKGKGEQLKAINLTLDKLFLVLIKPEFSVSTADAYANIKPFLPPEKLMDLIETPISDWPNRVNNQFEKSVFLKYPEINEIKNKLYQKGAVYASMSGSGSSVFGLFNFEPVGIEKDFLNAFIYREKMINNLKYQ